MAEKGEEIKHSYIENDKSFKKRKRKYIFLFVMLFIIELFFGSIALIPLFTGRIPMEIGVAWLIFTILFLYVPFILYIVIKMIIQTEKYQIKNNKFLTWENNKEKWIEISKINKIQYYVNRFSVEIILYYNNLEDKFYFTNIPINEAKRILKIFKLYKIKIN